MNSFFEQVTLEANNLASDIQILLLDYCELDYWNPSITGVTFINTSGDHRFGELNKAGLRLQSKILSNYQKYSDLLFTVLANESDETINILASTHKSLENILRLDVTWSSELNEVNDKARGFLDQQVSLLERPYASAEDLHIYVPDTNALIQNMEIENWEFEGSTVFEILLLPTVLSELDSLKVNHRNQEVRVKAQKIIRRLKEFRRRGSLTEGVWIIKNKVSLRALAIEPDVKNSLSWLDPQNNDDRFLMATIEVIRNNIRSRVILVSGDINLQNKAEYACLVFVEPPQ